MPRIRAAPVGPLVVALGVLAAGAAGSRARAHAPIARAAIVGADGAVVLRMPDFGWLVRPSQGEGFRYVCEAAVSAGEVTPQAPMAYRSDGLWLLGTDAGVAVMTAGGCPTGQTGLPGRAIDALVASGDAAGTLYAASRGKGDGVDVHRSGDDGDTWRVIATLETGVTTSMVVDLDQTDTVHLTQSLAGDGTRVVAVGERGSVVEVESAALDGELRLLAARSAKPRFWAIEGAGSRGGAEVVRASRPTGPWEAVMHLDYFGGFALDADHPGALWLGSEAGGIFRSEDGGDSFVALEADIASACLVSTEDALWACEPGIPSAPALWRAAGGAAPLEAMVAFDQVAGLARCVPAADIEGSCQAAWREWEVDVLGRFSTGSESGDAGVEPAPRREDGEPVAQPRPAGCHAAARGGASGEGTGFGLAWIFLCLLTQCRRGRAKRRRADGPGSHG